MGGWVSGCTGAHLAPNAEGMGLAEMGTKKSWPFSSRSTRTSFKDSRPMLGAKVGRVDRGGGGVCVCERKVVRLDGAGTKARVDGALG